MILPGLDVCSFRAAKDFPSLLRSIYHCPYIPPYVCICKQIV